MGKEADRQHHQKRLRGNSKHLLGLPYPKQAIAPPIRPHSIQHQNHYDRECQARNQNIFCWVVSVFAECEHVVHFVTESDCRAHG